MINDAEIVNQDLVTQKLTQQDNVGLKGFIAVKRNRKSIKKFFLSGVADSVSAHAGYTISYLEKRDIKPTYLLLFKSKRKGTVSAKLHVQANKCSLIENEPFGQSSSSGKQLEPSRNILQDLNNGFKSG